EKETEVDYRTVTINTEQKVSEFYDVEERLGSGKFGQVFKLVEKKTRKVWAGKFFKAYSAKDKENIRLEISIMNCLHHPKLVQCIDAFEEKANIVMVLELWLTPEGVNNNNNNQLLVYCPDAVTTQTQPDTQQDGQPEEEVKAEVSEPASEPEESETSTEADETLDLRCSLLASEGVPTNLPCKDITTRWTSINMNQKQPTSTQTRNKQVEESGTR
ncbi:UNVERIFIED_CONTAM: hypothetical protein K2H54_021090, partial [Gekko kuhli]